MTLIVAASRLVALGQPHRPLNWWPAGIAPASLVRRVGCNQPLVQLRVQAGGACAKPEAVAHDYFVRCL